MWTHALTVAVIRPSDRRGRPSPIAARPGLSDGPLISDSNPFEYPARPSECGKRCELAKEEHALGLQ
jgi:hypothetical protein